MATDNPNIQYGDTTKIFTYAGLDNGDDGAPLSAVNFSTKTVSVTGTFGTGGNVIIEGSNDGTNYFPMHSSPAGTTLNSIGTASVYLVAENPLYLRPRVSAGDGTTDLTVIFVCFESRSAQGKFNA